MTANEDIEPYEKTDFRREGLQRRLRREALGMTRRDVATLMGVEESTVYRWEHGVPSKRLAGMLAVYERETRRIRSGFRRRLDAAIAALGDPSGTVNHVDLHLMVPGPGVRVGTVWIFGEEETVLEHAPAGLLRALAGRLLDDLQGSPYLLFASEVDEAGLLLFTQAGESVSVDTAA